MVWKHYQPIPEGRIISTSLLYHTQGIRGFKHVRFKYHDGIVEEEIARRDFECPHCHGSSVSVYKRGTRVVTALPFGSKPLWLKFGVHTIYCHDCKRQTSERIPFLSTPKSRITRQLERTLVEYRSSMSILAMVNYFGVRWHTIRDVLLRFLSKEYEKVSLEGVTSIGIDEIMVGHAPSGLQAYKTIVRDLATGAVLWVGDGKGLDALEGFAKRLARSKAEIKYVTMDLGQVFTSWAKLHLPKATVVYDHFHVVKLMNDALDKVRRQVMSDLDEEERKGLKRQRFLLLRNMEDLPAAAAKHLEAIRGISQDLGAAHMMKEDLRAIYRTCQNGTQAILQLGIWAANMFRIGLRELKRVARTVLEHMEGIAAFWDTRLTNSHMEGFNSKLRGRVKMANGYRDEKFFKLKIYDLPDSKIIDLTHLPNNEIRRAIIFPHSTC